jgi:hypothetical protein
LRYIDRITGKLITTQAEFDALLDDPVTLDLIGLKETILLVLGTFDILAEVYLEAWARGNSPHEEYAGFLSKIRSEAIARSREEWQPKEEYAGRLEWFDRVVMPAVKDKLDARAVYWRRKAALAHKPVNVKHRFK